MLNSRKTMGLAVSEQGISAAQIVLSAERRAVLRTAALSFSNELNLDEPQKLGKELRNVLHRGGLTASRCVIGLAAARIAAKEKVLPATDTDSLRGILSIASEQEFASGPQELSFDYFVWPSEKGIAALLAAAPRRLIEQLALMAKAAGLSVAAVTSSALATAQATAPTEGAPGRLILCLQPGGVEVIVQSAQRVRLIRHLSARLDQPESRAALSSELWRIISLVPAEQRMEPVREALVWDSVGLDQTSLDSIGSRLGLPLRLCTLESNLGIADGSPTAEGKGFAQAAALALCAAQPLAIDFIHSRLAPPRKARALRPALWGAAVAAVLLAAGLGVFLDWRSKQRDVAALRVQLAAKTEPAQEAKALLDNISFGRAWYDRRPEFLNCLREITQAFPQEGRIWATSLMIREDMGVLLTGKSLNEEAALEVLNRLKSNPRLENIKPLYIRQESGRQESGMPSQEVAFAISLSLRAYPNN